MLLLPMQTKKRRMASSCAARCGGGGHCYYYYCPLRTFFFGGALLLRQWLLLLLLLWSPLASRAEKEEEAPLVDEDPAALWRQQLPDRPEAFAGALNAVFTLQSGAGNAADLLLCQKRTLDLMRRQRIPLRVADLRALSDVELYRLGIMAAVGGLGQWRRHETTGVLLVDDQGALLRALIPDAVESDVLMCLICALLAVVAMYHVVPGAPPLPAPPSAGTPSPPPAAAATLLAHAAVVGARSSSSS
jgi:hypothetical protein